MIYTMKDTTMTRITKKDMTIKERKSIIKMTIMKKIKLNINNKTIIKNQKDLIMY